MDAIEIIEREAEFDEEAVKRYLKKNQKQERGT